MLSRQNTHASLLPTNLRENVWKEPYIKDHKDYIAGKGINSLNHHNLVHKFIPMIEAMKIPVTKSAVDKELEKLEKIPAWQLTKVSTDGHLSSQEFGVRTKISKNTKVELYSEVTL